MGPSVFDRAGILIKHQMIYKSFYKQSFPDLNHSFLLTNNIKAQPVHPWIDINGLIVLSSLSPVVQHGRDLGVNVRFKLLHGSLGEATRQELAPLFMCFCIAAVGLAIDWN